MATNGHRSPTVSVIQLENHSSTLKLTSNEDVSTIADGGEYNPFDNRDVKHPTGDCGALAHLLKCSVGTGVLAMPFAFLHGGTVFGPVVVVALGLVCAHCMHILVKSSQKLCRQQKIPSLSFGHTAGVAFKHGPVWLRPFSHSLMNFVDIAICITCYSTVCVYLVFVATTAKQIVENYYPEEDFDIRLYIAVAMPVAYLLALVRNLEYLVPVSAAANVLLVAGFAITLYYMFREAPSVADKAYVAPLARLPTFLCTALFAMEGIGVVLPVENTMVKPEHFLGCPGVLNIGMGVVICLFAVLGFCGYLRYGDDTQASITLNLPSDEILAEVAKGLIAVAILFSVGLQFIVPTDIMWTKLKKGVHSWRRTKEVAYRLSVMTLIGAVAIAVPNLGPIISLVGAVCYSTMGLFCPASIDLATNWNGDLGRFKHVLWKDLLILALWLVILVLGTYTSVVDIARAYSPDHPAAASNCTESLPNCEASLV
ncbi:proton-coupled amino acid transporter-like protein CG1139 [Bacillus rossius redtenbacheri]|uniref:proton-coupled amino acid transporter-like protein CG1139 n=1 Tax=Bacillus rossius redtenbacheri TaxID=93214 RepID=UPI002FDE6B77